MIVEFVCTGCNDRSPMAYVYAAHNSKHQFRASGVAAEVLQNNPVEFGIELIIEDVKKGLERELFSGFAKEQALLGLNEDSTEQEIIDALNYCERYLMDYSANIRNQVLLEEGLLPRGEFRIQTKLREDTELVLTMTPNIKEKAIEHYSANMVYTIGEFTGKEDIIADPFLQNIQTYREIRDQIFYSVDKVIEIIK